LEEKLARGLARILGPVLEVSADFLQDLVAVLETHEAVVPYGLVLAVL